MRNKGFKQDEVRCTCGATFDSVAELLTHAYAVHGVEAAQVDHPEKHPQE